MTNAPDTIRDSRGTWNVFRHRLGEFLAESRPDNIHEKNRTACDAPTCREALGKQLETPHRIEWRGATIDEAQRLHNWPAGRALLDNIDIDEAGLPAVKQIKRVRRWSDDGDDFSRDRFDAGYLDCFETRKRDSLAGPQTVRVTIELTAGAGHEAETLKWPGLTVAKLADRMENAGYRVELAVIATNHGLDKAGRYNCADVIEVKTAEAPLNLDAVLLALAHPAFYRYHVFMHWLSRPILCNDGLGMAADTPAALQGDIHINKAFSKAEAERELTRAATLINLR